MLEWFDLFYVCKDFSDCCTENKQDDIRGGGRTICRWWQFRNGMVMAQARAGSGGSEGT